MNDIVVYTCVAGRYDNALMPAVNQPGIRFVCFTDQPRYIQAEGWEIRPLASPQRLTDGHYINRFHKFFPHRLFPDTGWSIYIDGNLRYTGDFRSLVARVRDAEAEIGAFKHPNGHTLAIEADVCALSKFDSWDFSRVEAQIATYVGDGVDATALIPTCFLLVRDHGSPRLAGAMSLWWSQLFEFTKRDQMSFTWVLQQTGLVLQTLDGSDDGAIDPARVHTVKHRKAALWKRGLRKLRRILP